jgi:hypothetical protein
VINHQLTSPIEGQDYITVNLPTSPPINKCYCITNYGIQLRLTNSPGSIIFRGNRDVSPYLDLATNMIICLTYFDNNLWEITSYSPITTL